MGQAGPKAARRRAAGLRWSPIVGRGTVGRPSADPKGCWSRSRPTPRSSDTPSTVAASAASVCQCQRPAEVRTLEQIGAGAPQSVLELVTHCRQVRDLAPDLLVLGPAQLLPGRV